FRNPHISVKQVAFELGFQDSHYFSRLFKKVTGETPGEYRERVVNYVSPKS
ncbi:MAG: AraC family transcriptional regulator, partial [Clostridia bacterium]|nr:AraC family transcriptional regulator [Clostridia bacterium]